MNKVLIVILIMLFVFPVFSQGLKISDGKVAPLDLINYPLEQFINEYAEKAGLIISYSKDMIKKNDTFNLALRKEVSVDNFHQYIIKILNNHGLTLLEDAGVWSIINTRDIRFIPVKTFNSNSFPDTNEYITIVHKMQYPLAQDTTRSLRPSLSRYARVVSFNDNKTILINEVGASSSQLLKIIASLDTQESYDRYLQDKEKKSIEESKKKPKEKSIEELEKKISELEEEKKKNEEMAKNQNDKKGAKNAR